MTTVMIPAPVGEILKTLEAAGYGAWCVGGCVRDALQTDAVNPKLEEALKLLEKMIQ